MVDLDEQPVPAGLGQVTLQPDRQTNARGTGCARIVEQLAVSEASYRSLVELSPYAVMVHGPSADDFEIRYVNRALLELLGYSDASEIIGRRSVDTFVHPDDRAQVAELRLRRAAGERLPPTHVRWIRRDRTIREVKAVSGPTFFDGQPGTLVYVQDVTEQVQLERARAEADAALRRSEQRYRLLFDATPLPAWIMDPATLRMLAVNNAMVRTYGYTRDELLAMTIAQLQAPEAKLDGDAIARSRSLDKLHVGVRKHRHKDGHLLAVDVTVQPIEIDGRRAFLGIGTDVTHALALEEQLRQSQKMEAIGRLAGGIAHDFNNILGVITANVDLALEALGTDHSVAQDLEEIASAATRAAALTRQLLAFSRKQPRDVKRVALNAVVTGIEAMLSRIVGENIRMTATLAPQLASIEADVTQLEQVLVNLVVNSRDAMPDGGTLAIETSNVVLDDGVARRLGVTPGRYVGLLVRDTGCGMDEATRARVFEPFFTTKEVGKGTGLGLATVFGIVSQSGGGIEVESTPGQGATFRIYFPAFDRRAASPPLRRRTSALHGSETVLLVEDDVQLRSALSRQLASWGYSLLEAASASEALAIVEQHDGPIDLLLTDLVMPGMDGRSLSDRLLARSPRTKVVFMSGHTEHPALDAIQLRSCDVFVQKPFTARALSETVRRAFGSSDSGH